MTVPVLATLTRGARDAMRLVRRFPAFVLAMVVVALLQDWLNATLQGQVEANVLSFLLKLASAVILAPALIPMHRWLLRGDPDPAGGLAGRRFGLFVSYYVLLFFTVHVIGWIDSSLSAGEDAGLLPSAGVIVRVAIMVAGFAIGALFLPGAAVDAGDPMGDAWHALRGNAVRIGTIAVVLLVAASAFWLGGDLVGFSPPDDGPRRLLWWVATAYRKLVFVAVDLVTVGVACRLYAMLVEDGPKGGAAGMRLAA